MGSSPLKIFTSSQGQSIAFPWAFGQFVPYFKKRGGETQNPGVCELFGVWYGFFMEQLWIPNAGSQNWEERVGIMLQAQWSEVSPIEKQVSCSGTEAYLDISDKLDSYWGLKTKQWIVSQRGLCLTALFNRQEAVEECSIVPWFLNGKKE